MDKAVSRFMVLLGRREGNLSLAPGLLTPARAGPNPALNPRGKHSEEAQGEQHSHGKALQTMYQRFRNFGCCLKRDGGAWPAQVPAGNAHPWVLGWSQLHPRSQGAGLGQDLALGGLTHHTASASPCRASTGGGRHSSARERSPAFPPIN